MINYDEACGITRRLTILSPLEKVVYTIECHRVATPLPSRGGVPEGRGGVCNVLEMRNVLATPPTPPLQGRGVPCGLFRYWFAVVQTFSSGLYTELSHPHKGSKVFVYQELEN